jgi:hypothetical protein
MSETNAVYMYSEGGNVIQYKSLFSPLTQTPPQYLTIINRSLTIQPFVSFSHSVPYTYYRSDPIAINFMNSICKEQHP